MAISFETYALCKKFAKNYCDTHASTLTEEQAVQAVANYFSENPNAIVTNEELEGILADYVLESEATPVINNIYDMDEDDTAHANWGGDWRMPTYAEIQELFALTWTYTEEDLGHEIGGRDGFETITANGNSLIIPSNGARGGQDGNYVQITSSELADNNENCKGMCAYAELWRGNNTSHNKYDADPRRYLGIYIRPVIATGGNTNGHTAVDLGLSVLWADRNIGATDVKDVGTQFAWGETSTKAEFTAANYKYILNAETTPKTYSKYVNNTTYGLPDGLTKLTVNKFVPKADIVDNLTTEDPTKVLSAKQGKVLSDAITNSNNVFIVKYGETAYDDIIAAIDAGKVVMMNDSRGGRNSTQAYAPLIQNYSGTLLFATIENDNQYVATVTSPSNYSKTFYPMQKSSDKASSITGNESDTNKYPTTKAVADYVTAAVNDAVADLIDGAPEALDTLKELADNFNGVATQTWVNSQGFITEHYTVTVDI